MSLDDSINVAPARCPQPRKLGKLLHIIRMIVGKGNYLSAGFFRNAFTCRRKSLGYKRDKMLRVYLVQKEYVSELIERHGGIRENLHHHVPFASIKAITYIPVPLPVRPQSSLKEQRVFKLGNILKLINAYNYLNAL